MSKVSQNPDGHDTALSLSDLPVEIHRMIATYLFADRSKFACPSAELLPLGSTNMYWRDVVTPYVFREVDLSYRSMAQIRTFVATIVQKYGRHCRSLLLSLRSGAQEEAEDSIELTDGNNNLDVVLATWHARRVTLLSMAVHCMPNVEHLRVATDFCAHHLNNGDFDCDCQCLGAYDSLLTDLTVLRLQSLHFHFGDTYSVEDGCDEFASLLLQQHNDTLRVVHLTHCSGGYGQFDPKKSLHSLASLPKLENVKLDRVWCCASLGKHHWKQSSVCKLVINLRDYIEVCDVSEALAALPGSLQDLTLTWLSVVQLFSGPFPTHLTSLRKFDVCRLSPPFIDFLRSAPIHTLHARALEKNTGATHLLDTLRDREAFQNLSTIILPFSDIRSRQSDWDEICFERGIDLLESQ